MATALLLAAAVALPPVVFRSALLVSPGGGVGVPALGGWIADAGVALLLWPLWIRLASAKRALWLVGAQLLWTALHHGTFEHVAALGALPDAADARYLVEPTFLRGSLLAATRPWLSLGAVVAGIAAAFAGRRVVFGRPAPPPLVAVLAGILLLVTALVWPAPPQAARWSVTNVFVDHLARAGRSIVPGEAPGPLTAEQRQTLDSVYRPDLNGEPRVTIPRPRVNVLLLVLEGISGEYLRPGGAAWMPELSAAVEGGLAFENFVTHDRATNRGMYSLLCGDFPKLGGAPAKMSDVALGGSQLDCLPRALAGAGYRTAYVQAAPLGFMFKDPFMQLAGFERVLGAPWFENAYAANRWGVDDRAFFEQSLPLIEELADDGEPWFLTLLTVGTHHPYVVPDDFEFEGTAFQRSVAYLDRAVSRFLAELERRSLLRDTLVVIVSDESAGSFGARPGIAGALGQNRGLLALLGDGIPAGRVEELFAQSDVAISLLDYLGLSGAGERFVGRSVFRSYGRPRIVPLANRHLRRLGMFDGRLLLWCREDATQCSAYRIGPGTLFDGPYAPAGAEEVDTTRSLLAALAARTTTPHGHDPASTAAERRTVTLAEGRVQLRTDVRDLHLIFGGQFLTAPAESLIEVELEVRAEGETGTVVLMHDVVSRGGESHYAKRETLHAGEGLRLRYTYGPGQGLEGIECRLHADQTSPGRIALVFDAARMTLGPPEGDRSTGAMEHVFEKFSAGVPPGGSANERAALSLPRFVAHAGGATASGETYTNSLEALDFNYGLGHRLFEVDFEWTRDGHLVAIHDWDHGLDGAGVPTLAEFPGYRSEYVQDNTPLDLAGIERWLAVHPDARVVTDIKTRNLDGLRYIARRARDVSRYVPQIYERDQYAPARDLGFGDIILTLYRTRDDNMEVARFASQHALFAVTMWPKRAREGGFAVALSDPRLTSRPVPVYAHTINDCDEMRRLWRAGVHGIYTDALSDRDGCP